MPYCLGSLTGRVEDIVVVDSNSADDIQAIAQAAGARFVMFTWSGAPPLKKQWALTHAAGRQAWTLLLDADEAVPVHAWPAIRVAIDQPNGPDGFMVPFRNWFGGRPLTFGRRNRKLCLFRTGSAKFTQPEFVDPTWEVEGHVQPVLAGQIGSLAARLEHHDRRPLFDYFDRHNRYSEWPDPTAGETQPRLRSIAKRVFYRLPARPLWAFLDTFIIQLGFLDGSAGFDFAMARAFYYWQIDAKRRALRHSNSEM